MALLLPPTTAAAAAAAISEIIEVNQFNDGGSERNVPPLYNTGGVRGPSRAYGHRIAATHGRRTDEREWLVELLIDLLAASATGCA